MTKIKKQFMTLVITTCMIFTVLFTAFIILNQPAHAAENWANTGFDYRKLITINSSKVNGNLVNFPVLIYVNDSDMDSKIQNDGDDICFYLWSDNTTKLNHETELYQETGGNAEGWFWVNVTSLSSSVDTNIWIYYGNSSCSSQENRAGTWDSDFVGVWHLNNLSDSIGNSDLANSGSAATYLGGKTAGCYDFENTSSNYLEDGTPHSSLNLASYWTVEAWVNLESNDEGNKGIVDKRVDGGNDKNGNYCLSTTQSTTTSHGQFGNGCGSSVDGKTNSNSSFINGNWHYPVYQFDTDLNVVYTYFDGIHENTTTGETGSPCVTGSHDLLIGQRNGVYFDGKIDEVRISKVVRTNHWLNTTYNVISSPTAFSYFGTEEVQGSTASLTLTSDEFTAQGEVGTTVYCNATGTNQETGNFSFTYDASDTEIEYLRINVTDVHGNITASNFSMQVNGNNSDADWGGNWHTFTDGGSNWTLNETNWLEASGMYGDNPFPVMNNNTYILLRVRVSIPAGAGAETYSATNWTWDAGYYP